MTPEKSFDCIAYKRAVQGRHVAETQGFTARQKTERRRRWLMESNHPVAQLWRKMNTRQKPAAVHDAVRLPQGDS